MADRGYSPARLHRIFDRRCVVAQELGRGIKVRDRQRPPPPRRWLIALGTVGPDDFAHHIAEPEECLTMWPFGAVDKSNLAGFESCRFEGFGSAVRCWCSHHNVIDCKCGNRMVASIAYRCGIGGRSRPQRQAIELVNAVDTRSGCCDVVAEVNHCLADAESPVGDLEAARGPRRGGVGKPEFA